MKEMLLVVVIYNTNTKQRLIYNCVYFKQKMISFSRRHRVRLLKVTIGALLSIIQ